MPPPAKSRSPAAGAAELPRRQARISADARRESIVLAARSVFMRVGFAGARTKEIAVQAGINEALIYRHFGSKQALFDASIIEPLERWMAEYHHLGGRIARSAEPAVQLELVTQTAMEFMRQINSIAPLLGIALFGREHHGAEFYLKRIVPVIDRWVELTVKSLASDSRGARLDPRFLSKAGFGIAFFLSIDAQFRGVPFDPETLGHQLAEFMLPMFERAPAPPRRETARSAPKSGGPS